MLHVRLHLQVASETLNLAVFYIFVQVDLSGARIAMVGLVTVTKHLVSYINTSCNHVSALSHGPTVGCELLSGSSLLGR